MINSDVELILETHWCTHKTTNYVRPSNHRSIHYLKYFRHFHVSLCLSLDYTRPVINSVQALKQVAEETNIS